MMITMLLPASGLPLWRKEKLLFYFILGVMHVISTLHSARELLFKHRCYTVFSSGPVKKLVNMVVIGLLGYEVI